jgi:PhoPQ-activated pathogenicity-related protein
MVNGANDPYWTVDALNLYWNDLKGDKSVLIVPNAGHSLREVNNGKSELIPARAVNTLSAFAKHMIEDKPWPKMNWKHADVDGNASLSILPENAPKGGRVWAATCETRDFRKCVWKEMPVEVSEQGKLLIGRVKLPEKGCVALYGEVEYEIDNLKYTLSTQVRVCEMK